MAAISSIKGNSDAALTGQVEKTARPEPAPDMHISHRESLQQVQPKGVKEASEKQEKRPSSANSASYEEAQAVVEKLQNRIDEISADPHKVSIRTDEETKRYIIQIQDPEGNVVKQFPPEKVLNLHQKLDDLSGMVIDEMI